MSAFEAVGYAKFSDRSGVCLATSGPGDIHLLNGLYDAKLDHVPLVAIVGQTNCSAMGGSYQQEVDLLSLFKDVASDYLQMVGAGRRPARGRRRQGPLGQGCPQRRSRTASRACASTPRSTPGRRDPRRRSSTTAWLSTPTWPTAGRMPARASSGSRILLPS